MSFVTLPIVLDVVAKASLILAATALVAATLRRASASARHFVWTLGLLSALAAPALSVALPRWELPLVTIPAAPAARGSVSRHHQLAQSQIGRPPKGGSASTRPVRPRVRPRRRRPCRDGAGTCAAVVAGVALWSGPRGRR